MKTDELIIILETGASVTINADRISLKSLRKAVRTASVNGGRITLTKAGAFFTAEELLLLAEEASPGTLTLEGVSVED